MSFQPGDVVCLRSGGPDMTVASIVRGVEQFGSSVLIRCQWFNDDKKLEGATFNADALIARNDMISNTGRPSSGTDRV